MAAHRSATHSDVAKLERGVGTRVESRSCVSPRSAATDPAVKPAARRSSPDMTNASVDHRATPLPVGTEAPDFELPSTPDQVVSLSEFRGQPVILAFYPADWSPVCGDQMALYQAVLPEFRRLGAELIGISVDNVWCHLAFAEARHLHFPLLSDFEPKGAVARAYGAYRAADGEA